MIVRMVEHLFYLIRYFNLVNMFSVIYAFKVPTLKYEMLIVFFI